MDLWYVVDICNLLWVLVEKVLELDLICSGIKIVFTAISFDPST